MATIQHMKWGVARDSLFPCIQIKANKNTKKTKINTKSYPHAPSCSISQIVYRLFFDLLAFIYPRFTRSKSVIFV